jgi:hypothetical protein
MARYITPVTSSTALAVDTAFAGVIAGATTAVRQRIRRVIIGTVAGTSAVADQQLVVAANRATAQGTNTKITPGQLDDGSGPSVSSIISAWSVQPTLAAQDLFRVPFNAKSGVDLPFELIEELWVPTAVATPIVFVNRSNALPASTSYVITIETEE